MIFELGLNGSGLGFMIFHKMSPWSLTLTICNKITANRVKPAKVPLFCYNVNNIISSNSRGKGAGALKGILGRGVPPRPSNPSPV